MRKRALVRFARPSMFMVPRKLVLMVLMGLYLQRAHTAWPQADGRSKGDCCTALVLVCVNLQQEPQH